MHRATFPLPTQTSALLLLLLGATSACRRTEPPATAPPAAAPTPSAEKAMADTEEEREGRRRFRDAMVFVDGVPVRVLKFRELPPDLQPTIISYSASKHAVRFSIWRYVESLGVDMKKLREVHLHGGRARASVLRASVLEKYKDTLTIQFTQQVTGKPGIKWPDDFDEPVTPLDIVTEMSVYVDKTPPAWSPEEGAYRMPDGTLRSGVPFASEKDVGGTRLYMDGKLVTFMRRPAQGPREEVRDLGAAIRDAGVDLTRVKVVELLDEDKPVTVAPGPDTPLGYSFPPRQQGRMRVHVGGSNARDVSASAIQLWSTPQPRAVVLPEKFLAQPAIRASLGL